MEKKLYVKPTIKVSVISETSIMANSDPDKITGTIDSTNPITNGSVDAKRFHIWDEN